MSLHATNNKNFSQFENISDSVVGTSTEKFISKDIDIDKLYASTDNPYHINKDSENYERLKMSIKINGLLEPLIVIEDEDEERYRIVSGHRRYECLKDLGIQTAKCDIINKSLIEPNNLDYIVDEIMVDANLARDEISVSEQLDALLKKYKAYVKRLEFEEIEYTQESVAEELGINRKTLRRDLKIAELIERDRRYESLLNEGILSKKVANIIGNKSESLQNALFEHIERFLIKDNEGYTYEPNIEHRSLEDIVRDLTDEDIEDLEDIFAGVGKEEVSLSLPKSLVRFIERYREDDFYESLSLESKILYILRKEKNTI